MCINLFDVLFWYCCLQRKDLGKTPDEFEMVDASAYISGLVHHYESAEQCTRQISNALAYFIKDERIVEALLECALDDVKLLLQSKENCRKCLLDLLEGSFRRSPKQAHCLRLDALVAWFEGRLHADWACVVTMILRQNKCRPG
jgi:hypothetical protein